MVFPLAIGAASSRRQAAHGIFRLGVFARSEQTTLLYGHVLVGIDELYRNRRWAEPFAL